MKMSVNKLQIMLKLQKQAKQAVAASAIALQDRIVTKLSQHASNIGSGGIPSPAGSPPGQNTGALARSIQSVDVTTNPMKPTYRVGTNMVYAKIQEYGGRITPKKGKYLPVPIGLAGRRALRDSKGDLRSLHLKIFRAPNGKLFLYRPGQITARNKKGERTDHLLFRLVKSVYLPARPYFRPAIAEHRKDLLKMFKGLGVKL